MRTGIWIAALLLAITIGGGLFSAERVLALSERYVSAAEELQSMTEHGEWQRASETADAYLDSWEQLLPLLQTLINHEDTDGVTMSLVRIRAGIRSRDASLCMEACAELRENALHLYHRDAFTWGNVL